MDPVTGEVRFSDPDYESKPSYVFTVTASDGELSDSADIFLSLNDVAFKPADRNPVENVVVENWRPGSEIGLTLVSDLTGHGEVTFSLQDNPHFEMHPTTGKVTVKQGASVDYETVRLPVNRHGSQLTRLRYELHAQGRGRG